MKYATPSHDQSRVRWDRRVFYIYCLKDPRNGAVRYVGQCNNPRKREYGHRHLKSINQRHLSEWIKELAEFGLVPFFDIIENVSHKKVYDREIYWIKYYAEMFTDLLNIRDNLTPEQQERSDARAAAMLDYVKRGFRRSEEYCRKISEANKRAWQKKRERHARLGLPDPSEELSGLW